MINSVPDSMQTRPALLAGLLLAGVLVATAALLGYYILFSTFLPYDDEGYWLMVSHLLHQGEQLYDTIYIPYGPVAVVFKDLLHNGLDIAITNTNARYFTLLLWLGTGAACAAMIAKITHSRAFAALTLIAVFYYLRAFSHEPGHPQELIACLSAMLLWVTTVKGNSRWWLIGATLALLAMTKINAGVYYGMAAATALLLASNMHKSVPALLTLITLAFPFILLGEHLQAPGGLGFAVLFSVSFCLLLSALYSRADTSVTAKNIATCATAFVSCLLLLSVYLAARNTSIISMLQATLFFIGELKSLAALRDYGSQAYYVVLISTVLLVFARYGSHRVSSCALLLARTALAGAAVYAVTNTNPGHAHFIFLYGAPFIWAIVLGEKPATFNRAVLALAGLWSALLSYPVPGSQIYFGSFALVVAGILSLNDMLENAPLVSRLQPKVRAGSAIVITIALGLFAHEALHARKHYGSLKPINQPGTSSIRIPAHRVAGYAQLVTTLDNADVVFITSGMNSLYFWSTANAPAPAVFQFDVSFLRHADRDRVRAGLERASNPIVLRKRGTAAYGVSPPQTELTQWLDSEFVVQAEQRGFDVLTRR